MINNMISNLINNDFPQIEEAKDLIKEVYLEDSRPWVVGYSGGKDSTVVVQLVFEALNELPKEQLHKKIYVISSDTLVETPLIISSINDTLRRVQEQALKLGLPIETHKVKPPMEKSFWVNIIGKGYPSPNQKFRWCTDRLKIDPANQFILDKVSTFGEVIMVLGVRDDESATRANVMKSHTVEGKVLMRHSTLSNAFVFAPIRNFSLDDVWSYLLNFESPWGDDNHALNKLYQDSASGECPLVVDKTIKESAGSCGNSRFGCWTCTVVTEDKALNGFIESGEDWMLPLLEFRNWLADIRDVRKYRQKYRMNGQVYFRDVRTDVINEVEYVIIPKKSRRKEEKIPLADFTIVDKNDLKDFIRVNNIDLSTGDEPNILIRDNDKLQRLGLGPFTMAAREMILRKLLEVQKNLQHPSDPNYELISEEELKVIRRNWLENGEFEDRVPQIYREVMGYDLDWEYDDRPLFDTEQITDLELLSQEMNIDMKLLKKLISIEKDYNGYKIRRGIAQEIEKALKQDYLHL
ncbi:DNA phosphorothioation system sulfurtransferase DndC [Alkalihalophilus pseudofirmus]|uniref:DNA phosphorothioation system sulfurtransferase DndC n=1 Tax=Alkalihalophilus pseudofirmus TaxID=79885 RepID=A0AAJ2L0W4_ALKPS|nr:DNA phosphorothioation system sulfurtransferase DndC [Alkalihalophilus pseudofirmus]MDV2884684.1 DNA phosphorothioation system sulfurtransferase DndC [Alkalihalophilus pseudofirmus]